MPSAPKENSYGAWKHDMFPQFNGANKGERVKEEIITFPEEIIKFPPKRLTQKEKNDVSDPSQ